MLYKVLCAWKINFKAKKNVAEDIHEKIFYDGDDIFKKVSDNAKFDDDIFYQYIERKNKDDSGKTKFIRESMHANQHAANELSEVSIDTSKGNGTCLVGLPIYK